jgi:hypothetical protein
MNDSILASNYNNLDFRINLLFDYMYNRDKTTTCHEFRNKPISDIKLIDIKETDTVDNVLTGINIQFIEKNHGRYIFKRMSNTTYPSLIRVGLYDKSNTNYNNMTRGEIVDMKFSYVFSNTIKNNINKFILLPLMFFDATYGKLKRMNSKITEVIKKDYHDISDTDILYVHVLECYNNVITLEKFIDQNKLTEEE